MTDYNMDKFNNIKLPDNIDSVIINAAERAYKKRNSKLKKALISIAAALVLFAASVNLSPAFAKYVSSVPGLEYLVKLVSFNKGLQRAAENGYTQNINKSAEDKGIKFTVNDIILDSKTIVVAYTIEATKDGYTDLNPGSFDFVDKSGKQITGFTTFGTTPDDKFKSTKKKDGAITMDFEFSDNIPDTIILKCKSFKDMVSEFNRETSNKIDGNWEISMDINKDLVKNSPDIYKLNKEKIIGPIKCKFEDVEIYPTVAEINVSIDNDEKYKFIGFVNARLIDDKGVEYKNFTTIGYPNDKTLKIESTYFTKSKTLNFKADGIYYMPKDQYVILDLENQKIIDDCGYGLELLYINRDTSKEFEDEKYDFDIGFKVKDPEIIQNTKGWCSGEGIDFDEIVDEKGNKLECDRRYWHGIAKGINDKEDSIEDGFCIKKSNPNSNPKLLKLRVSYVSKGTIEPINIKIK